MERAARETADFPAAMMALKRAAAPNGRRSAWARRHRTTAKPRATTTMPAARAQADGVRSAGLPARWRLRAAALRGGCASGRLRARSRPKVDARHRAPFSQAVQLRRVSCSSARLICSWACASRSSAPGRGIAGVRFFRIRRGVHWRFPFPSNVIRRWRSTIAPVSVLSKDGRMMVEYWIACRRLSARGTSGGAAEVA